MALAAVALAGPFEAGSAFTGDLWTRTVSMEGAASGGFEAAGTLTLVPAALAASLVGAEWEAGSRFDGSLGGSVALAGAFLLGLGAGADLRVERPVRGPRLRAGGSLGAKDALGAPLGLAVRVEGSLLVRIAG